MNLSRFHRKLAAARRALRLAATSLHDAQMALWSAANTTGIGEREAALLPHLARFQEEIEGAGAVAWRILDQIPDGEGE